VIDKRFFVQVYPVGARGHAVRVGPGPAR
jgi:hypothetical protein